MKLSLVQRLFVSSGIALCIFLGAAGLGLEKIYSISLESIVREKLQSHIYLLLSLAENENGMIYLPKKLSEPRFNVPDESLIALVTDGQHTESWRSLSASNKYFSLQAPGEGQWLFAQARDDRGSLYYVSSYSTIWPDSHNQKNTFVFTVMEGVDYYHATLASYRLAIVVGLTLFGLVLSVLLGITFHWGLKPLRQIAMDVDSMSRGELQSLDGHYPKELQPLTENLNLLIANESRQRKRYLERMADLSHSLKTPLSVLRGIESDIDDDGKPISRQKILKTMVRQVSRMTEIVNYQLLQIVPSSENTSFIATNVANVVHSIIAALNKVYVAKPISVIVTIDPGLSFYGDENDLTELLGNLLDNAYQYCSETVHVTAHRNISSRSAAFLSLVIDDDGVGIPISKRDAVLKRGVRLDSTSEGQGFGLAIVVGIIGSYNGTISVADSELGGASFRLKIPDRQVHEGAYP